ncbi:hypothetical protein DFH06DRAFT_159504 [Mycena polygramma]|nr:hypothetical protein DFH06DRAFT_159504 [Mycena polygramma]
MYSSELGAMAWHSTPLPYKQADFALRQPAAPPLVLHRYWARSQSRDVCARPRKTPPRRLCPRVPRDQPASTPSSASCMLIIVRPAIARWLVHTARLGPSSTDEARARHRTHLRTRSSVLLVQTQLLPHPTARPLHRRWRTVCSPPEREAGASPYVRAPLRHGYGHAGGGKGWGGNAPSDTAFHLHAGRFLRRLLMIVGALSPTSTTPAEGSRGKGRE